jgi:hypothetical protein
MKLFEEFFSGHKDLLPVFRSFDSKWNLGLIKKLEKETNRTAFEAMITEIHYALFFEQYCSEIHYEYKAFANSDLTPDWTIIINDQTVILEVVRLNAAADEQCFLDFNGLLFEELEKIKKSCYLKLDYDFDNIDKASFDLHAFGGEVDNWLAGNLVLYESRTFSNGITLDVIGGNTKINHVCVYGPFRGIKFKPLRLTGQKSRLLQKVKKYSALTHSNKLPFIIGLYFDFHSWFEPEELNTVLYGHDVIIGWNQPETDWYSHHDLSNAMYYTNEDMQRDVSGILLRQNNTFSYFHNYYFRNLLNKDNSELLKQIQHK